MYLSYRIPNFTSAELQRQSFYTNSTRQQYIALMGHFYNTFNSLSRADKNLIGDLFGITDIELYNPRSLFNIGEIVVGGVQSFLNFINSASTYVAIGALIVVAIIPTDPATPVVAVSTALAKIKAVAAVTATGATYAGAGAALGLGAIELAQGNHSVGIDRLIFESAIPLVLNNHKVNINARAAALVFPGNTRAREIFRVPLEYFNGEGLQMISRQVQSYWKWETGNDIRISQEAVQNFASIQIAQIN